MSDSKKSSASATATVSYSSKDLSTTSEDIPSSDDMPQALPYISESSPEETPQEETKDDILSAVLSESSEEEDPPVPLSCLRRNLEENVRASQENIFVEPSQLNGSPVCNFRAAMYLKFAINALSNPEGSERVDVDDNGFNIDVLARFSCTKALYGKKLSFLALSQELTGVGDEGTGKLDIRVLVVKGLSGKASGSVAVDDDGFNVTTQNSIKSALAYLRLNPAQFLCTNPLNGKRFSFPVSQELADINHADPEWSDNLDIYVLFSSAFHFLGFRCSKSLNEKRFSFLALPQDPSATPPFNVTIQNSNKSALAHLHLNGKRFHFLVLLQESADIEDETTAVYLAKPEGSDSTVDIRLLFSNPFLFFGFRGSKPLTVQRFSFLALPHRLAHIEVEATLYHANKKGDNEVDTSFILELTRATHVPPSGALVPAFVGQGSQPPANQMLGGPGLGLGPPYLAQGGPMAIPAVVAQGQVGRLVHIIDILVPTTENSDDNNIQTLRSFQIPENRTTSWGWLAEEVYDTYLLQNPNHQFDQGIRLNPYICWPHRSVSYTSLSGQTFVWPNSPWEIVKQGLIHINIRGGWA